MTGAIASFKWQPASGQQIGSADQYPYDKYGPSFTADDVHAQALDPNAPNTYGVTASIGDMPVQIQEEYNLVDDGSNGWVLDNLYNPVHTDSPGTSGHELPMDGNRHHRPDRFHQMDIYQAQFPPGTGRNFYGRDPQENEVYFWNTSSLPAETTGAFPLDARIRREEWPEPFDSYSVAPQLPVVRPTETIPMRRMREDDRPVFRQLAVPGQNIQPSGSVYNPTMQSNPAIHNVKPLPAFGRVPTPPWSQDEMTSASQDSSYNSEDVLTGWNMQ